MSNLCECAGGVIGISSLDEAEHIDTGEASEAVSNTERLRGGVGRCVGGNGNVFRVA